MKTHTILIAAASSLTFLLGGCATNVQFREHDNRIDVRINEQLFTSYLYALDPNQTLLAPGAHLTKPVLFPVYSPTGELMTRGYPFIAIEGDKQDHPHHTGVYFTVDINEDHFWGNSREERPAIRHIKVLKQKPGRHKGRLNVLMHWVGRDGRVMLEEKREMIFRDMSSQGQYAIDMTVYLTAREREVVITDTKEGMMAVRVAHWLTEERGSGRYLSSNGDETEENVWGKRAEWMRLEGRKDDKVYGIAIFNHPDSVNYPTYWHARGYGCFSANPVGQGAFERTHNIANASNLNLALEPGAPVRFKFRLLFYEGARTQAQLQAQFKKYAGLPE